MELDRRAFMGASALAVAGASAAGMAKQGKKFRRIATEEAFTTPEQYSAMMAIADNSNWDDLDLGLWRGRPSQGGMNHRLALEGDRLAIMDEHGVDMHVLSLTSPGVQMFAPDVANGVAQTANDRLAEHIRKYPGRFAGLGAFAPQDPANAVKEMERAINTLKLNGFISNSHTNGEYLDNPKYWPILEAAEALDAPIYIHPRSPSRIMAPAYRDYGLELAIFGYQAEVSLHAMRLILSGVLDRFPKLQIVLGHMGENMPFHLWRMDQRHRPERAAVKLKPSEYFLRNFSITTSGMQDTLALDFSLKKLGPDRVMWAIDYPYEQTGPAVEWMDKATIADADKLKVYSSNAERVFKIK